MAVEKQHAPFDTTGMGALHDMQLDYYGKRAAAASADHIVHVYEIADGRQRKVAELKGHEGPVWKVSWAHPKFGSLIATCGYDMKVIVWKETVANSGQWQIAFMDTSHGASVNDVQFCPWEYGLRLACASSDGTISVLSHSPDQQWRRVAFPAHPGGAQALSWMPAQQRDGVAAPSMRLVSGGCDNSVTVWKSEGGESWGADSPPMPSPTHCDWVRAVASCPSTQHGSLVATGGWDKTVCIWAQEMECQAWRQVCKLTMGGKVEALTWSVTGSILAVAFGDGEMVLYKEAYNGSFEEVGRASESGFEEIRTAMVQDANNVPDHLAQSFLAAPPTTAAAPAAAPPPPNAFAEQQQAVMDSFGGF